ncbi:MAG: hypothetical protein R2731_10595 [Nocardioides sp.]
MADLDAVAARTRWSSSVATATRGWLSTAALDALDLARRQGVVAETEWFAAYPRLSGLLGDAGATPADGPPSRRPRR